MEDQVASRDYDVPIGLEIRQDDDPRLESTEEEVQSWRKRRRVREDKAVIVPL